MGAVKVTAACRPYWNYQVVDLAEGTEIPAGEFADYLLATGASVEPLDGDPPAEDDPNAVPAGSIAEVLAWVDGDPARARAALEVEQAKGDKARSTLITALAALLTDN